MDFPSVALEAIPKALVYAAAIVSVGVSAARLLFLSRVQSRMVGERSDVGVAFGRAGVQAAAALLLALLLRAWAHTAVSFGFAESFSTESLRTIAWESQWGAAWKLQLAVATTLVVLAWGVRQVPQVAWILFPLATVAVCYALPMLGHAEGEPTRVVLHGSHVLAAGVWVGTLVVMAFVVPRDVRDAMLRAFAPFAFVGSSVIAASGLVATWWYLQSPMNLLATTYGWVLALKLLFVADVATFGFLNWRRVHRPGATGAAARVPTGITADVFVYLEVAMATVVIVLTAVLTELEHP